MLARWRREAGFHWLAGIGKATWFRGRWAGLTGQEDETNKVCFQG